MKDVNRHLQVQLPAKAPPLDDLAELAHEEIARALQAFFDRAREAQPRVRNLTLYAAFMRALRGRWAP